MGTHVGQGTLEVDARRIIHEDHALLLRHGNNKNPSYDALKLEEEFIGSYDTLEYHTNSTPWWVWPLLTASVLSVSSAGSVFASMKDEVHPLTLASWRLQCTSIFLILGASFQWRTMDSERKIETLASARLMAISGAALAVHFGTWVTSIELTSLPHSMLLVSTTPVLLALMSWARGLQISRGEAWGTAVGVVGSASLVASIKSEKDVHLIGDAAAFTACIAFVPYLLIGRHLRVWMPLFVYAAPVTFLAAGCLTLAGLAEGSKPFAAGKEGMVGWIASTHFLPLILYLGIVPGIIGHTSINVLLRYVDPLVITLALNTEPLVGSFIGWAFGVSGAPGTLTYAGGALILASTAMVSFAARSREQRDQLAP